MKCLLKMDCYALWKQLKFFLAIILLYILFSLVSRQYSMLGFSILFLCMLPYYMMQMTQETLFLILPCNRKRIVQERYLTALLVLIPGLILSLVSRLLLGPESLSMLLLQLSACLLILAIQIPLIYKFGTVRARLLLLFTMALFFGSSGAIAALVSSVQETEILRTLGLIAWIALPVSVALLGVSYLISLAIYEKKEF